MAATEPITGSCLCNSIEFTIKGSPENVFECFCTHCAKNAGSRSQISAKYRAEQVQIEKGQELTRTWVLYDNFSGHEKHKVFCQQCGCTLWTIPMHHGGTHLVVRTSLIENGLQSLPPQMEFFTSRKHAPDAEIKVKSFNTMPSN